MPARDLRSLGNLRFYCALAFQLAKIGANLNQLAKIANETQALPHETELRVIAAQLVAAIERVIEL